MKKRTITMYFYGPTDVDEVTRTTAMMREIDGEGKVSVIKTQSRTVYYAYNLSMLQFDMASDINNSGMPTHKGTLVRIDPTSDDPYVIEVGGKEESYPFVGTMTRD